MAGRTNEAKLDLTPAQRKAILDRDGHECQSQLHSRIVEGKGKVHGADRLEVDHLIQKRHAHSVLGFEAHEISTPELLLTKCHVCHSGHPESHHPDTLEADEAWRRGDKQAYTKMAIKRDEMVKQGKDYGNNHDRLQDMVTAEENTAKMDKEKPNWWPWPRRNRH